MPNNHHMIDGVKVPFTQEEEEAWIAEGAAWDAAANDRALVRLRIERNQRLKASDWTQVPDSALTDEVKAEWTAYRTALRDLPSNTSDPANPTWPDKPS